MADLFTCDVCGRIVPKTNYLGRVVDGQRMKLCGKHYSQYARFNKFIDNTPDTQYDRNQYEITEQGIWIFCHNRQKKLVGKFIIDKEDFEEVIKYKWRLWQNNFCTGNTDIILIHQFLMQPNENQVVDHINGDRSDNRRNNLRITTQDKNCINKDLQSNNTSGVAGVSWDKERNKWAPEIAIKGRKCHLGRYQKFEDAVYARYIAELVIFDDFRSFRNDDKILNIIDNCNRKEDIDTYVVNKLYQKNLLDID